MPQQFRAPRGFNDFLPGEQFGWQNSWRWQVLEARIHEFSRRYGYQELRPPMIEEVGAFVHGTGETTDVVTKEMFPLQNRSQGEEAAYAMRPEITVGMVRAYLENGLANNPQPTKIYTYGPAFRYERPQKGRYRQLHQWDVEVFGTQDPALDAEVIKLGMDLAAHMGIPDLVVKLNSIGCPVCRPVYREKLIAHFKPHIHELCEDCQTRMEQNPLRLLDCKKDADHPANKSAPAMVDHLCAECDTHFKQLQGYLNALGVPFEIDTRIVRGLDYYTKTVFEVQSPALGAQSTLWGGGRYDGLIKTLGGKPTPGVGFGLGMDRLQLVLDTLGGGNIPKQPGLDVFVAPQGAAAKDVALKLLYDLRAAGLSADTDYLGRSFKAQFKYANKLEAGFVAVIGDDELANGTVAVKNMATGEQQGIPLADVVSYITGRAEPRAVKAALQAVANEEHIIERPTSVPVSSDLSMRELAGRMVIDIERGATEVFIISSNGVVTARGARVTGDALDTAIVQHVKRAYNLLIGELTSEEVTISIGSALPVEKEATVEIRGRDLTSGLPRTVKITSEEAYKALKKPVEDIIAAIKVSLGKISPELAADILERGIILTGGDSLLRGLGTLASKETGVPVQVSDAPLLRSLIRSAKGTSKAVEIIELMPRAN